MKLKRKQKVLRFLSSLLVIISIFTSNVTVFAAESAMTMNTALNEVQPRGSLSGYGSKYAYGSSSFSLSVNGSWSPFAGCTIKTEGFSSNSTISVSVYDSSGSCKTTKTLGPNDEKANIAIFNVSPGTYKISYTVDNPSNGTVSVWIY